MDITDIYDIVQGIDGVCYPTSLWVDFDDNYHQIWLTDKGDIVFICESESSILKNKNIEYRED